MARGTGYTQRAHGTGNTAGDMRHTGCGTGHTAQGMRDRAHSTGLTAQGMWHVARGTQPRAHRTWQWPCARQQGRLRCRLSRFRALDSGPRHSGAGACSAASKARLLLRSRHAAGHGHSECGGWGCPRLWSPGGAAWCHREGTRQHPGAASLYPAPTDPRRMGVSTQRAGGWARGWCFIGGIMQPPNITVTEKRGQRGHRGWVRATGHRPPGASSAGGVLHRDFPLSQPGGGCGRAGPRGDPVYPHATPGEWGGGSHWDTGVGDSSLGQPKAGGHWGSLTGGTEAGVGAGGSLTREN